MSEETKGREVAVTNHAVARYIERHAPHLSVFDARAELRKILAGATDTGLSRTGASIFVAGDICLIVQGTRRGQPVCVTVLDEPMRRALVTISPGTPNHEAILARLSAAEEMPVRNIPAGLSNRAREDWLLKEEARRQRWWRNEGARLELVTAKAIADAIDGPYRTQRHAATMASKAGSLRQSTVCLLRGLLGLVPVEEALREARQLNPELYDFIAGGGRLAAERKAEARESATHTTTHPESTTNDESLG